MGDIYTNRQLATIIDFLRDPKLYSMIDEWFDQSLHVRYSTKHGPSTDRGTTTSHRRKLPLANVYGIFASLDFTSSSPFTNIWIILPSCPDFRYPMPIYPGNKQDLRIVKRRFYSHITSCIDFPLNAGNSDAFAVTRLLSLDARYWLLIASLLIISDLKRYHAPPLYDLPPNPLIKSLWMRCSPNPSTLLIAPRLIRA